MVRAKESSVFSRRLINLFAGMSDGAPELPRVFFENGYKIHSIEKTFTVQVGTKVNAELILCSDALQHTLILDAKSGANLKPKQLQSYAAITEESLKNSAFTSRSSAKRHNVLLIGKEEYKSRLLLGSIGVPSPIRVLSIAVDGARADEASVEPSKSGLYLIENKFVVDSMSAAFDPLLEVNWDLVPVNYLPLDHESEDWEFAERLIPELIIRIREGKSSAKVDELGLATIGLWRYFVAGYKTQMVGRLDRVLKLAAQKRFAQFMNYGDRGRSKKEVIFSVPESLRSQPGKLQARLSQQSKAFMEDLQSPQIAMIYGT